MNYHSQKSCILLYKKTKKIKNKTNKIYVVIVILEEIFSGANFIKTLKDD